MSSNKLPNDWKFTVPTKEIKSPRDMNNQTNYSPSGFQLIAQFIERYNDAVKGTKNASSPALSSRHVVALEGLLDACSDLIARTPPLKQQEQRYGNIAFRKWMEALNENINAWLVPVIPEEYNAPDVLSELKPYIVESFGSPVRLDYGSGHELSFILFLIICERLSVWSDAEMSSIVTVVFRKYLRVVRKLQVTYKLEPAGSHGVWGLDDYQFLPFLWGSAQLMSNAYIYLAIYMAGHACALDKEDEFPSDCILEPTIINNYADDYLYFEAIKYIHQIKTGLFAEHSTMLYDISGVPTWEKINAGLMKMYANEVLGKFPIVQHVLFGSIIRL